MPDFDGISIKIRVNGVDVPEFKVEKDLEERKVTCWVPSQVGKEFQVIASSENRGRGPWKAGVLADGIPASNNVFTEDRTLNIGFYRKSELITRPFIFSKVELVDDDDLLDASQASRMGEIEVICRAIEIIRTYRDPGYKNDFVNNNKIHERAKKGIAEHVGLGEEVPRPCIFFEGKTTGHIATFIFRYRSLDYLRAQGIAPHRPPSKPVVPANKRHGKSVSSKQPQPEAEGSGATMEAQPSVISDSDEEIRSSQAELIEAGARKRKQKGDVESPSKRVKVEFPKLLPGEVIDLT